MPRHSTRSRSAPAREVPAPADLSPDQVERRTRIVDAAVEMMIDVDYGDIQVKDVAARAEVALGTLYRYFGSKEHLMATALVQWSEAFRRVSNAPADGALPAIEQVKLVYQRAARAFERQPRVFGALMQVQASTDPLAAEVYAEFAELQLEAFGAALADLPAETGDDIVDVMSAVLSEGLRNCQSGRIPRAELRRRLDRAAELLVPH